MVEALQFRELEVAELENPLWSREILEAMLAEVGELGLDQDGRRGGYEHLAAMTARGDAGSTVDVVSDVALSRRGAASRCGRRPVLALTVRFSAPAKPEAAASAPGAVGNAKKKASPCVSTSTPPWAVHASRIR